MPASLIQAMPKVELHIHLEGTIAPGTLLALARRNGVRIGPETEVEVAEFYRYKDFLGFIDVFTTCVKCLQTPDDVYRMTRELLEDARRQNVLYREVFFSPQHYVREGLPYAAILEAIGQARKEAARDWGVELNLLLDISREMGVPAAELATERAIQGLAHGVVGLGIGGDEANFPAAWFSHCFDKARAAGLRLTAHAGEAAGPESIRSALDDLKAERIGHGVRIVEDPALVERVLDAGVTLEMCPTSNVCTGVVPSFEAHPLPALLEKGLKVTVNSDDPPMFNTTLTAEYEGLARVFGMGPAHWRTLNENAIRASFLSAPEKDRLTARYREAWESATAVGAES